jgi:hypothetical protein
MGVNQSYLTDPYWNHQFYNTFGYNSNNGILSPFYDDLHVDKIIRKNYAEDQFLTF